MASIFVGSPSRHSAAALFLQVQELCTDLDSDLTFLYILTIGTCANFVRENNILALGVHFLLAACF